MSAPLWMPFAPQQQTGSIGRQRLLATGIGRRNHLAIVQIVRRIDPVDKNHPRLGKRIGRAHDLVPQPAGLHRPVNLAAKHQIPGPIRLHRRHEPIGDQHRQVEHPQPRRLLLGRDEILHIRVIAAHRRHHRPAPAPGRHDRAAHRIPHIHEAQGPRRIRRHPLHRRPLGPDGREIVADPATLLHGQGRLAQRLENAAHRVRHCPHHEAVEQGDRPRRARPRHDPPGRQELEILQRRIEPRLPDRRLRLPRRQRPRNPRPGRLHRRIQRHPVRILQPIFHIPDLLGDGGSESGHGAKSLQLWGTGREHTRYAPWGQGST